MSLCSGMFLTEKAQQSLGVLTEGLTFHVPTGPSCHSLCPCALGFTVSQLLCSMLDTFCFQWLDLLL